MRKTFKLLCCALALLILLPFAASCGSEEPADITMWVVQLDPSAVGINFSESPVFKKLEEISGKKIKMIMGTDYNTLLATRSYPEVVVWGTYPGGYDKGLADGVIWDLTDLIDEYAPNYKKILMENPEIFKAVSTSDGRIPAMYEINDEIEGPWYGYYMRKDILDAYGFDIPVTYDDWEEIFDAVQQGKTGVQRFVNPLYISPTGVDLLDFINAGYDVAGGGTNDFKLMEVNGQIQYGPLKPEFKEYITMMNRWYNKKYISPGFSLGGDVILPPLADIVGTPEKPAKYMAFPYTSSYEVLEATAKSLGIDGYELVPVPYPRKKGEENKPLHIRVRPGYMGTSMVITDKCKDRQLAIDIVKWFDYLYSEEGALLMNFGIEGESYTMVDGVPMFTQKVLEDPVFNRYKYATSNFPTLRMRITDVSLLSDKAKEAQRIWSENNDGSYILNVMINLPADKADEATVKITTILQYYREETVKFINNTRALSTFDSFITQLNALGASDVINLYQQAYDAFDGKQLPEKWRNNNANQ